jgi:hypothetical protein
MEKKKKKSFPLFFFTGFTWCKKKIYAGSKINGIHPFNMNEGDLPQGIKGS